jgi:hypothetical protein
MSRLFVRDQANRLAGNGATYRHYAQPFGAEKRPQVTILLFSHSRDANQISKEHSRSAGKPLELASIEFARRCQDGAPSPLWLKGGWATRPQNEVPRRLVLTTNRENSCAHIGG